MSPLESAREIALKYIDYQPRTSAEVRRRLIRERLSDRIINSVVEDLERAGFLDDARFSADWVESRTRRKGYGKARLTAELRRKGISREMAEGGGSA